MADNTFELEILPDGKIKVVSEGAFSQEQHKNADEILALIKELAGGEVVTKKLAPNLGSPHTHSHKHGHHHHKH